MQFCLNCFVNKHSHAAHEIISPYYFKMTLLLKTMERTLITNGINWWCIILHHRGDKRVIANEMPKSRHPLLERQTLATKKQQFEIIYFVWEYLLSKAKKRYNNMTKVIQPTMPEIIFLYFATQIFIWQSFHFMFM